MDEYYDEYSEESDIEENEYVEDFDTDKEIEKICKEIRKNRDFLPERLKSYFGHLNDHQILNACFNEQEFNPYLFELTEEEDNAIYKIFQFVKNELGIETPDDDITLFKSYIISLLRKKIAFPLKYPPIMPVYTKIEKEKQEPNWHYLKVRKTPRTPVKEKKITPTSWASLF